MHSAVDKLMSATEIISEGPEGIILESVLEGYAEYYSADLAEKVVRGQTENILKGRCNGGRGTFGYTLDFERKFHIDPLASPFVMESFKKYNEGSTMALLIAVTNYGTKNLFGSLFAFFTARLEMLRVLLLVADAQDCAPDVEGEQRIEENSQRGERDLPRGKGCLVGRAGGAVLGGVGVCQRVGNAVQGVAQGPACRGAVVVGQRPHYGHLVSAAFCIHPVIRFFRLRAVYGPLIFLPKV